MPEVRCQQLGGFRLQSTHRAVQRLTCPWLPSLAHRFLFTLPGSLTASSGSHTRGMFRTRRRKRETKEGSVCVFTIICLEGRHPVAGEQRAGSGAVSSKYGGHSEGRVPALCVYCPAGRRGRGALRPALPALSSLFTSGVTGQSV